MNCIHSYVFSIPNAGCFQQYSAKSRLFVSSINASDRSRTVRSSASIISLSRSIPGSTGIGDLRRIHRDSTSAIGRWIFFNGEMRFGGVCATRSAFPITARSTIIKCATNSAADHRPSLGLVFHSSIGTASAAHKSPFCDFDKQAVMYSRSRRTAIFQFISSNGTAASLFKGVRELQNTGLAKGRPKNLQAHRQLPPNLAARDGYSRHARQ